jgi:arsenate reductase
MAEAWTKKLKSNVIDACSAGTVPKGVDPRAIKAMAEVGIDISTNRSKSTVENIDMEFDYVITLCDNAQQACPFFPAKTRVLHHGFEDPPVLAAGAKNEEEAMAHYRRIRDEIKAYVETLPESLNP